MPLIPPRERHAEFARRTARREGLLHAYRVVRGEPRHFWMYARTWPPETVGAECG